MIESIFCGRFDEQRLELSSADLSLKNGSEFIREDGQVTGSAWIEISEYLKGKLFYNNILNIRKD